VAAVVSADGADARSALAPAEHAPCASALATTTAMVSLDGRRWVGMCKPYDQLMSKM